MIARSPRDKAPSSNSVMAVDLPVPVVPITLKCLVSSAAPTSTPARASDCSPLHLNGELLLQARHPVLTRAPRLYRSMASVTSNYQIIGLLSVGRRLAIHSN